MNSKRFTVLNHEYMNTGGHCMVSLFTVYDRQEKALRYVVASDDMVNVQSMDNISEEPPADLDFEDIVLASYYWSALTSEPSYDEVQLADDEWELLKYCQFEFYKKDCSNFNTTRVVPLNWLPPELYNLLPTGEIAWLNEKGFDVGTDGSDVYMPDEWTQEAQKDFEWLQQINNFKKQFDYLVHPEHSNEELNKLAEKTVKLEFDGSKVELPFNADTFTAISSLLDDIINEW